MSLELPVVSFLTFLIFLFIIFYCVMDILIIWFNDLFDERNGYFACYKKKAIDISKGISYISKNVDTTCEKKETSDGDGSKQSFYT